MSFKTSIVDLIKNGISRCKTYTDSVFTHLNSEVATTEKNGFMSSSDKSKLIQLESSLNSDVLQCLMEGSGSGLHNCLYRGKNLGSVYTDKQKNAIASGEFTDLWIGDYWHFDNVTYTWEDDDGSIKTSTWSGNMRIAEFDYSYLYQSVLFASTVHHVIIVPDTSLFLRAMNSTNSNSTGYEKTEMRTKPSGLARAKELFLKCFGENTLMPRTIEITGEKEEGSTYKIVQVLSTGVELMTEPMVFGSYINDFSNRYLCNTNSDATQLKVFTYDKKRIPIAVWYWLQSIHGDAEFVEVARDGQPSTTGAAYNGVGVRPAFVLRSPN